MRDRLKNWWQSSVGRRFVDLDNQQAPLIARQTPIPAIWLFGKTGSGKTSVIRYLTGAESARIGTGFRPETKASQRFDFPTTANPILTFIDTRGLGEIDYDADDEIERFDASTHLMLVTVRALDHALESIIEPLTIIRKANRSRPVILVLTCLHEAYPQTQHPQPDPYLNSVTGNADTPESLQRSIARQCEQFEGLVDAIVPIDLTPPDEGYDQPDFGGDRLKQTMIDLLPKAYRQTFQTLDAAMQPLLDHHERRAVPYIVASSILAATAAAVPVPWIDLPVVAAIQTDLVRRLAKVYGQQFDLQEFGKTAGAISGPLLFRQLIRGPLKLIPGVGIAANSTLAFASTYALGKATCWYQGRMLAGEHPTRKELQEEIERQMQLAKQLWQHNHPSGTPQ